MDHGQGARASHGERGDGTVRAICSAARHEGWPSPTFSRFMLSLLSSASQSPAARASILCTSVMTTVISVRTIYHAPGPTASPVQLSPRDRRNSVPASSPSPDLLNSSYQPLAILSVSQKRPSAFLPSPRNPPGEPVLPARGVRRPTCVRRRSSPSATSFHATPYSSRLPASGLDLESNPRSPEASPSEARARESSGTRRDLDPVPRPRAPVSRASLQAVGSERLGMETGRRTGGQASISQACCIMYAVRTLGM